MWGSVWECVCPSASSELFGFAIFIYLFSFYLFFFISHSNLPAPIDAIADREKRGTDHLALTKMDGSGEEEWSGTDFSAPYKLDCVVNFHVGDVITSVSKSTIVSGASQILLYTTLFGVCLFHFHLFSFILLCLQKNKQTNKQK